MTRERLPNRGRSETFDLENTFGNRSETNFDVESITDVESDQMQKFNGNTEFEPRFKLVPFDKISLGVEPRYLVKGLIPRSGLVVLWGPPKCGKSFLAFDLAMHVALGWDYRGRRVHKGAVVYCAFEGGAGFQARAEGFHNKHLAEDREPIEFYLLAARANLATDHAELIQDISLQLPAKRPTLVVFDTLNRSLQGSESSDEDMAAYVQAADAIRDAFDCAVLIVHHCGIDDRRPRGHTSLTGAADAQLAVKRNGANDVILTVEWMKDGPEGDTIASRLEPIIVGTDSDGEDITSCVVVPIEHQAAAAAAKQTALQGNQKTMFAVLCDAGPNGLLTKEWDERGREAGIGVKRRPDLYDARIALKNKKLVRQYGDRWTVDHQSP